MNQYSKAYTPEGLYHTIDPNLKFKMTPFSPPPFIQIPDEPMDNKRLIFKPRTSLMNPLRDVWDGKIKDMVNLEP